MIKFKYENIKLKKKNVMWDLHTSKLYDKIIKMPSKSHDTIPLIHLSKARLKILTQRAMYWNTKKVRKNQLAKFCCRIKMRWRWIRLQLRLLYIYMYIPLADTLYISKFDTTLCIIYSIV
jgi:hypothetical protein